MTYANATTADLALSELLAHLTTHPSVVAILEIGSLAAGALTPASDYDIVIVLGGKLGPNSVPTWYVGITQVAHRATDLIFVAASEVKRVTSLVEPVAPGDGLVPVLRWIQQGHIVFDRTGLVTRARRHLSDHAWILPSDDAALHAAWFAINYNLSQTRRMLLAEDALYRTTAAVRMAVYGHTDVWHGYFTLRKLVWKGDKAAVAYLRAHDPEFLAAYQRFIATSEPAEKLPAYERAAACAAAPWGGLWPRDAAATNVAYGLEIWQALLEGRT